MPVFVLEATVSGILFAILALLTGAVMTASTILPQGEPAEIRRELLLFAFVLLLAFLLVSCISLVVQGAKLEGGHLPSSETVGRYVLRTQSGKIWLVREIYALLLTAAILWAHQGKNRKAVGLFLFSLPLVASRSLMSHAAAVKEHMPLALAADAIHLIASALWGGALPVLFGVLYYGTKRLKLPLTWSAGVVSRFSRLALGSVAMLILTGLYQSLIHVGNLHTLLETPYGNVLLSKLFLVFVMLGLGLLNFFSTRRRLLQQAQRDGNDPYVIRKALTRIGAESFLGLLVFSVTGFLTTLPPGIHAQHQRSAATTHHHPALKRAPAQGASVQILSPKPGELFQGDQVRLQYKLIKGKRGHHVHAYVDGELMGMFASESGTLTGISKGQHVLELRVVAEDHQTELDASDKVPFVVR